MKAVPLMSKRVKLQEHYCRMNGKNSGQTRISKNISNHSKIFHMDRNKQNQTKLQQQENHFVFQF